jgi:hypothetical protein
VEAQESDLVDSACTNHEAEFEDLLASAEFEFVSEAPETDVVGSASIIQNETEVEDLPASKVLTTSVEKTIGKKGTFLMCDGALPVGDDLLVESMPISKARAKCRELVGCRGFTYEVVDGEPLVHFKSKWELTTIPGEHWISYRYVEALPSDERLSAGLLVHKALQPDSQVGFPQITEICDRLEANPEEIPDAVSLLVGVLRGPESYQLKLKTLTIICEMLYNIEVVPWFTLTYGFFSAIKELRSVCNTALGETAESSIRMLATEIDKVVDSENHSSCSSSSSTGWSGSGRLMDLASSLKRSGLHRKVKSAVRVTGSTFKTSAQKSFDVTLKVASPHLPIINAFIGMKTMAKQRSSVSKKQ